MEQIVCSACGSKKINFLYLKNNYKIFQCSGCLLAFVFPVPSNLSDVYSQEYFIKNEDKKYNFGYVDYENDKQSMKETFNFYLKELTKENKTGNIFDIGTATGFFLDLARDYGLATSGCEISDFAAGKAREKGHTVLTGQFDTLKIENKFSIVTAWDVLEHLPDPQKSLFKINTLLNINSLLAINTVDITSWWANIWGQRWHLLVPPEHLFYFSPASLKKMIEKSGFEIIKIEKVTKKFSLAYIFNTLFTLSGIKIFGSLADKFNSSFWRKFMIPINLRDNVFIIAKKNKDL